MHLTLEDNNPIFVSQIFVNLPRMIEEWLHEYMTSGAGIKHRSREGVFIIYKGFKIVQSDEGVHILDVRRNDFYNPVSKKNLSILKKYGFIKGCDMIMYHRDRRRVYRYRDLLEKKYRERDDLRSRRKEMTNKRFNVKAQSLERLMRGYVDKVFFYETRKNQLEIKYNLKDE